MLSNKQQEPSIVLKLILLFLFTIGCGSTSCATQQTDSSIKLGVITDLHFLSEKLIENKSTAQNYATTSGRNILASPEVIDLVVAEYLKSDIDVLLIPGDLTKDGEKQSHLDLTSKLKPLLDKGVKIYVIPGNHDINMPNSVGFGKDGTFPAQNISPSEFTEIYDKFGYSSALQKDTASLSYVAQLDANKWLIAIDGCRYKEYKKQSISGGKLSHETEQWIIDRLNEAKEKNITVVGMMHHGLVEHIIYQSTFFSQYLIDDWERLANKFADAGLKAIFTGHFHATDITKFTSKKGNSLYDIETGALCTYPFAYRFIDFSTTGLDIETKNITSTASFPNLANDEKANLLQLGKRLAIGKIKSFNPTLSDEVVSSFSNLAGTIFLKHIEGDETIDENLKKQLDEISKKLDIPVDLDSDSLQLDFYPADNNVRITFDSAN